MKKFWIQFVILGIVIIGSLYLAQKPGALTQLIPTIQSPNSNSSFAQKQLKVGSTQVKIEVADTASKRGQGLSGKDTLAEDQGMLFVFPEEKKHQIWMKGMKFSLDLIFIRDGVVVDILKDVPAPLPNQKDTDLPIYEPVTLVDMLLEVKTGFVNRHGIKVGDKVTLAN